jgi:hypothetical protein
MENSALVGRAKELEVASLLIRHKIYVFFPLVDSGADLLAANRDASVVVPIQVKYRSKDPGLCLNSKDLPGFDRANTVLAFIIGAREQRCWFIPYRDWKSKSVDNKRRDKRVFVPIQKNSDWLKKYEGDAGVRLAFRQLLT